MRMIYFIGILFMGTLFVFFWNKPVETVSRLPVQSHSKVVNSIVMTTPESIEVKSPIQRTQQKNLESRSMAQASTKAVHAKTDLAASFELKELPGTSFEVVTNYIGVKGYDGLSRGSLSGYQLQDASDGDSLNIILNKQTRKYGVWTREIIVSGSEQAIDQLQQKLNLERLNKNSDRVMFRVSDQVMIEEVISVGNLKIEPDIIYSRVSAN